MKIRIKFSKLGHMRFIGHLDLLRYFQKAMRRAGVPIKYSEGFSPHQIMSFASPLSLGIEGYAEYMDIEIHDDKVTQNTDGYMEALNQNMCEGMEVLSFKRLPEDAKNSMACIAKAKYKAVVYDIPQELDIPKKISEILASSELIVDKKTKTGIKPTDIRPLIYDLSMEEDSISMYIANGSMQNLKPELLLDLLLSNGEDASVKYKLYRLDLFDENDKSLGEYGDAF